MADDLMDHDDSFEDILINFGLTARAVSRFMEDYATANDLLISNEEQIKLVVNIQNKMYRSHATANQRWYINTAQLNRNLAFYKWTIFAIKDARAFYDENSAATFDLDWVNSISEAYNMEDPKVTPQSTAFSVTVPTFVGTNWHDVKAKMTALLMTRIGNAGVPLTYLIRERRRLWENTDDISNLQERRIATKAHAGTTFELDNSELYRILLNTFTSTTLDNVVRSFQRHNDGIGAWAAIIANVEGANYPSELKRQGDQIIENAFFDPNKNFTFEKYFDKHVKSHELHAAANAPVPEWRKIDQFMKNIKCSHLQNDYRNLKDGAMYQNFTAMYNKLNENYRTMIQQGIIKPISIFKRKINSMDSNGTNNDHRGGRGRGNGRGRGGRGRGRGRGRHGGRGRGRGRGGRGNNNDTVDISCLPSGIDLQNLSFSNERWHEFTQEQKSAIWALRNLNGNRNSRNNRSDDVSSLGQGTVNNERQVYQLVQVPGTLPPAPDDNQPPIPPTVSGSSNSRGDGTRSTNAGNAFGRN